jgi:hypothetical protein
MKKVISLAVSCVLAASMCLGALAEGTTLNRSVTEQGEAAYMTMTGLTAIGDMQITVTRDPAADLDAELIAQIESAAGDGAVCQEVLQVVSTIEKGAAEAAIAAAAEAAQEGTEEDTAATEQSEEVAVAAEETAEAAEQTNEIEVVTADGGEAEEQAEAVAVAEEEAEREEVYLLHSLVLSTDLQEPDDVTMTVWFYDAVDDVWVTSEDLYDYDHKEGTLLLVLQPGYTKAAIVTVQHKGVAGYLRTVQNKLLKLM